MWVVRRHFSYSELQIESLLFSSRTPGASMSFVPRGTLPCRKKARQRRNIYQRNWLCSRWDNELKSLYSRKLHLLALARLTGFSSLDSGSGEHLFSSLLIAASTSSSSSLPVISSSSELWGSFRSMIRQRLRLRRRTGSRLPAICSLSKASVTVAASLLEAGGSSGAGAVSACVLRKGREDAGGEMHDASGAWKRRKRK